MILVQKMHLIDEPGGTRLKRVCLAETESKEFAMKLARQEGGRAYDPETNKAWTAQSGCWLVVTHDLDGQFIPEGKTA